MARPLRVQDKDVLYHVTTKSNLYRIAFADDLDRTRFLTILAAAVTRYDWECLAYCLMTTHYHLLLRPRARTLARGMQLLNGSYALGFNKRHREATHVFGDRYFNGPIRDEAHLVRTIRYIVLNPVEAGICDRPEDWPWSSYRAWLGLARWPDFLAPNPLGEILVGSELRRRTRELVEESLGAPPGHDPAPPDDPAIDPRTS